MALIAEPGVQRDFADRLLAAAQRARRELEAAAADELADRHSFVAVELARDVAGMAADASRDRGERLLLTRECDRFVEPRRTMRRELRDARQASETDQDQTVDDQLPARVACLELLNQAEGPGAGGRFGDAGARTAVDRDQQRLGIFRLDRVTCSAGR